MASPTSLLLVAALLPLTSAPHQLQDLHPRERLFCASANAGALGELLDIRGGPPWNVQSVGLTDGGRRLRRFGRQLYVVHTTGSTISRFAPGVGQQVYDLGHGSEPQDILDPAPAASFAPLAFVTRRENPNLHRLNLVTGVGVDVLDLSPVGGGDPIALGTMARDGNRLFVQVRVFRGKSEAEEMDAGVLAVVDLPSLSLVDVEPLTPGVQGVALQGAPPHLKMQVVQETRTLFVSTTDGILDNRGGIEMVDLDGLTSVGYALSEAQSADLGGFVMITPTTGYFVFHTDLLASTHLKRFTIAGGPDPGPEIIVLLGAVVDVLEYDPRLDRIFLPTGDAGGPQGIYVFDAITKQQIGPGPIATPMRPHDLVVAR